MTSLRISKILYAFTLSIFICCSFSFVFFNVVEYKDLVKFILEEINRIDLTDKVITTFFPIEKFNLIHQASYFFSAISFIIFIILVKYSSIVIKYFQKIISKIFYLLKHFKNALINNPKSLNLFLLAALLVILVRSIYYASTFYIQYDEAWNCNYFLRKNILYTLFAYNNYPLHNLFCWIVVKLFYVNTFFIRLPSILTGVMVCLLAFVSIKKIFNDAWLGFAAMLITAFLPVSVYYMLYSRGVLLEVFFSLLVCFFLIQTIKQQQKISISKIAFIALINGIGTFSMLSHIYFIVLTSISLTLYSVFTKNKQFSFLLLYPVLSLLFSCIFLLPMIMGTGISMGLLASVETKNYLAINLLPYHCYSDFISGYWFVFYLLFAVNFLLFIYAVNSKFRFCHILNITLLISPILIKFFTGIYPPERATAYLIICPIYTVALMVYECSISKIKYFIAALCCCILLSFKVHFDGYINWSKGLDEAAYKLSNVLKENHILVVYDDTNNFFYFVPALVFYTTNRNDNFTYNTSQKQSTRYLKKMPHNTDCVISNAYFKNKVLIYSYENIFVYKK